MERGSAYIVPNIVHECDLVSKNRMAKPPTHPSRYKKPYLK